LYLVCLLDSSSRKWLDCVMEDKAKALWKKLCLEQQGHGFDVSWREVDAIELSRGLDLLPPNWVGIEIGTHNGASTCFIANYTKPKMLLTVDVDECKQAKENTKDLNVTMVREKSESFSREWSYCGLDLDFDFIFIDGDHSFSSVVEDINCWSKHLKVGGIMSGHDFTKEDSGVKNAVNFLMTPDKWLKISCEEVWVFQKMEV